MLIQDVNKPLSQLEAEHKAAVEKAKTPKKLVVLDEGFVDLSVPATLPRERKIFFGLITIVN